MRLWVDDLAGLGLVEIGVVELRPWAATVDDYERADSSCSTSIPATACLGIWLSRPPFPCANFWMLAAPAKPCLGAIYRRATTVALPINELVSNAFKLAFPMGRTSFIPVRLAG